MELFVIARCTIYLLLTAASFQVLELGNGPSALNSLRLYALSLTFAWLLYLFSSPFLQLLSWMATAVTCGALVSFGSRRSGRGAAWGLSVVTSVITALGYLYFLNTNSVNGLHHTTALCFGATHSILIYFFVRHKNHKTSADRWVIGLAATMVVIFSVRSLVILIQPDLNRVLDDLLAAAQPFGDGILLFALLGYGQEAQSNLLKQQRILNDLAYYDNLTKLPNRHLLHDRFRQVINRSKRLHSHCAILFLDLDNFKLLNDAYGHDAGDQLLVQMSERLMHIIRESDTAARIGGDEFVVLLEGLGDDRAKASDHAEHLADKIRVTLAEPYQLGDISHQCTASIGCTVFLGDEFDPEQLLNVADKAMYEDKFTAVQSEPALTVGTTLS